MKCINKNLEPIKELLNDFKEPVLSKILDSFPDDYIPTKEEALAKYSELLGSSVDYKLKVINALQSDKVRQPNKNFQGFLNDLQKQGVPKEQLQLLQQEYKEGDNKEDLISTMLANYSYTIEINTAKGGKGEYDLNVDNFYTGFKKFERNGKYFISYLEQISDTDYETIEKEVTKEEYKSYEKPNTQYYSNLTVPGGTNYTENEISIPGQLVEEKPQGVPVKEGVPELFESNPELANAVYEALGYNQIITPNDKIVFGHPGIGKTFAKKSNDFIDVDEDYKEEHAMQKILRANAKNSGKKEDLKEWEDYVTSWWSKVKSDAKKSGKRIFVSNLPILRMFPEDFDKILTLSKEKFIERAKQRDDYVQGETEDWKSSLDIEISKIDKSKVFTTDKYLSDLLVTPQQKQQAQQLYSQYLDTIFPNSKVKDIVYHHSDTKLTEFKKEFPEGYAAKKGVSSKAKFFLRKPLTEEFLSKRPYLGQYLVNIVNPNIMPVNADRSAKRDSGIKEGIKEALDNNQDSAIFDNIWDNRTWSDVIVVFEPEQIHILGSKQDIEGFKSFIKSNTKTVRKGAITPSIKGHAQFSTDNGIGWFRSDDKMLVEDTGEIDEPYYNDEEGWVYDNTKKKHIATKTRRILEVQSDLFQKGRDKEDLISESNQKISLKNINDAISNPEKYWTNDMGGGYWLSDYESVEQGFDITGSTKEQFLERLKAKKQELEKSSVSKENQFLQLLNKDNNWVKFFVQSIIQSTARQTVLETREEDIIAKIKELENLGQLKIEC